VVQFAHFYHALSFCGLSWNLVSAAMPADGSAQAEGGAHCWALFGRFTSETMAAARHANAPELSALVLATPSACRRMPHPPAGPGAPERPYLAATKSLRECAIIAMPLGCALHRRELAALTDGFVGRIHAGGRRSPYGARIRRSCRCSSSAISGRASSLILPVLGAAERVVRPPRASRSGEKAETLSPNADSCS
jgi:hypothetical protein